MTIKEVNTPSFKVPNGDIPAIGYGTGTKWQHLKKGRAEDIRTTLDENLSNAISQAIKLGVTHIDTAEIYTTHIEVAHGIKQSGIERSKIWITDKYSPGYGSFPAPSKTPYEAIKTALRELEVEYIDLYLIHAQFFKPELTHGVTIEQAWADLEKAHKEGLVKNIGLSNFDIPHIEKILKVASVKPSVLQIEFHAYLFNQSPGIIEYAKKNDILVEAYGPLSPVIRASGGPLDPVLKKLGEKYGKNEAQVLLRWVYQQGILPITTSSSAQRITEALAIFEFELEQADVDLITKVGSEHHFRAFFPDFDK